jgi:arginyl-tRNA synthetase
MFKDIKADIKEKLENIYQTELVVEASPRRKSDLAIPLFKLAKETNKNIQEVAGEIKEHLKDIKVIKELQFERGFLNIYFDRKKYANKVIDIITKEQEEYPKFKKKNEVVSIDFSSPNIAKNFNIGHLRSTVIGASLAKIYEKTGYDVIKINHLGDFGTQFGKLIVAYNFWGNEKGLNEDPIKYLQELYIKFHNEADLDSSLEDKAREVFKHLEDGDEETTKLWQKFRDLSLVEFKRIYDILNINFDSYDGEAFFVDKTAEVVKILEDKKLLKLDEGAQIVDLEEYDLLPALIKRADGATLYLTRDIAAVLYRMRTYNSKRILYVVGNEQKLHFEQLKKVVELMGYDDVKIEHVNFGLVLLGGKKMRSREGNVVNLKDVLIEAKDLALEAIEEKNPNLKDKEKVAEKIGVSAVIFNDLKNDRNLDIEFNLEQMLSYEGLTGPYLQYSSVRIYSILKNQEIGKEKDIELYEDDIAYELILELSKFSEVLIRAVNENAPFVISRYLLNLAKVFNQFYANHQVLVEDEKRRNANLTLIKAVRIVLNEGMRLLGMSILDEM